MRCTKMSDAHLGRVELGDEQLVHLFLQGAPLAVLLQRRLEDAVQHRLECKTAHVVVRDMNIKMALYASTTATPRILK